MVPEQGLKPIVLQEVYVSDKFPATFVSESLLAKRGCAILKKGSSGAVFDAKGDTVCKVRQQEGLYFVDAKVAPVP